MPTHRKHDGNGVNHVTPIHIIHGGRASKPLQTTALRRSTNMLDSRLLSTTTLISTSPDHVPTTTLKHCTHGLALYIKRLGTSGSTPRHFPMLPEITQPPQEHPGHEPTTIDRGDHLIPLLSPTVEHLHDPQLTTSPNSNNAFANLHWCSANAILRNDLQPPAHTMLTHTCAIAKHRVADRSFNWCTLLLVPNHAATCGYSSQRQHTARGSSNTTLCVC